MGLDMSIILRQRTSILFINLAPVTSDGSVLPDMKGEDRRYNS
jgi:hypothetical protein